MERTASRAPVTALGNAKLRMALWIPVLGAVRRNPWLRTFYERLRAAGKPPKPALIAAMRKLLHAIYNVAKNRGPSASSRKRARRRRPRLPAIRRRSKSSLSAALIDSPVGSAIAAPSDVIYGTESYIKIGGRALKIATSSVGVDGPRRLRRSGRSRPARRSGRSAQGGGSGGLAFPGELSYI
jgi:hypothetical protein